MEVVAPGGVRPAPFALCPRYGLLAVGMASSAAARGEAAESGASRVDVLRLPRGCDDDDMGRTLQVDCVLHAPGLRRVAWSDSGADDDTKPFVTADKHFYPSGLLAGGFNDGAVRIWTPEPALHCDLRTLSVPEKPNPVLVLSKDPNIAQTEEHDMCKTISQMYSDADTISWTCSEDKVVSQHQVDGDINNWEIIEHDADSYGWDVIDKEQVVFDYQEKAKMTLIAETHELNGPVLGLSFSGLIPHLIATAAMSDKICIHDLQFPVDFSRRKHEFSEVGFTKNSQITCLKWSKTLPTILGSSGDAGITTIWDLRSAPKQRCFSALNNVHDQKCCSDFEFSWNNPMHIALSTIDSATVQIWDIRKIIDPFHAYASGNSGVLSLSWNRLGQLLASHTNGEMSCYDVYKEKMVHQTDLPHCDYGSAWMHMDNVAATLSSKNGVKLCKVGG